MTFSKFVKSNQESATAAWIDYLKSIRLEQLQELLDAQKVNLANALQSINVAQEDIYDRIININRGGAKGMHGFIAEAAEYGIENAKKLVEGKTANVAWLDDDGPIDLIRGTLNLQLKFTKELFSLDACREHLKKYPSFLKDGGKYMIPKDFYENVKYYYHLSKSEAMELSKDPSFQLKTWKKVQAFFEEGDIPFNKLTPAEISYDGSQVYKIDETLETAREEITQKSEELENIARAEKAPSHTEGLKATGVSALVEGTTAFALAIRNKVKNGKSIKDFTDDDWIEIAKESGLGVIKGGIRGAGLYIITNFTPIPAVAANGLFTASFGVAGQLYQYKQGNVSKEDCLKNAEILCIESSVSSVSSLIGQAIIPIPVLGAIIGNSVGNTLYTVYKDCYTDYKELKEYALELQKIDEKLSVEHQELVKALNENMLLFTRLLEETYSQNPLDIIDSSAKLAAFLGVPYEEILDTPEKASTFFNA